VSAEPKIRILDKAIVERIAAGEVIENPASAVKELIENALDAGSTAIQVEIRDGGLSLIRVSDNGEGMSRADASLALKRHATSKVRTLEDLATIRTLGFRGEALASIAAVSRLEMVTRAADELEGTRQRAGDGGTQVEPAASPVGTSVAVRDLFYNVPARRKFLKSPLRERERVQQVVVRYSLAYPAVAFRLVADGREVYAVPPGTPLERIGLALGREVAGEMVEVGWQALELRARGFVSRPTLGRASREGQYIFVNGRPVRAGVLAVALERPYAGRLPPGRHPLAVIHLDIDPRLVDVNVHPRKAEVLYLQERAVYQAVQRAVQDALAGYPVQETGWGMAWPFDEFAVIGEPPAPYTTGSLRALGQVHNTYIVAQSPEGLVVVDQHAAHEQILFERLSRGDKPHPLTPPARIALTAHEARQLVEHLDLLAGLGIEVEPFGGSTFLIRSLPEALASTDPAELITALLDELGRYRAAGAAELGERLAMRAACAAAVRAGDLLPPGQVQALLDDLAATWSPATCPHGRPAFVTLTLEELEKRFLRR
jgi:DNA mismatch repair protein MutL